MPDQKKYIKSICGRLAPLILLLQVWAISFASAQDTLSAGGLLATARKQAIDNKDYAEAIRLGKKALLHNPLNTEMLVFVGRTYSWAGNTDSAIIYLKKAEDEDTLIEDTYIATTDAFYWNKNYTEALQVCHRGLSRLPTSQALHIRKARILMGMADYRQAARVVDTVLSNDRKNADFRELRVTLKDLIFHQRLTIKFDYAHFDKQFPDPWRFYMVEYTNTGKKGSLALRANIAERFKTTGIQYEADAYPRISKTFYMYLNLGFSDQGAILPRWRSGLSLFANLPHAFEAELGTRYLQFNSDVFFYTGYVAKYYKNFLIGSRVFLTPSSYGYSRSTGFIVRYFYGGTDDYVNINAFAGISPDDRRYNLAINTDRGMRSSLAEISIRKSIRKLNIIMFNASQFRQEYLKGITGTQIQFGMGYTRRF